MSGIQNTRSVVPTDDFSPNWEVVSMLTATAKVVRHDAASVAACRIAAERIGDQAREIGRLRRLADYLDDPFVLLKIPPPIRLRISELLHGD